MTKSKEKLNATELVQRQLWRNGHSAKNVSAFTRYNLLVNEDTKVEVKSAEYRQSKDGIYWQFKNVDNKNADVLAIVISTPLDDILIYYMRYSKSGMSLNGPSIKVDTKRLKVLFTDSLTKTFNK